VREVCLEVFIETRDALDPSYVDRLCRGMFEELEARHGELSDKKSVVCPYTPIYTKTLTLVSVSANCSVS
jgi:hypothetical protein